MEIPLPGVFLSWIQIFLLAVSRRIYLPGPIDAPTLSLEYAAAAGHFRARPRASTREKPRLPALAGFVGDFRLSRRFGCQSLHERFGFPAHGLEPGREPLSSLFLSRELGRLIPGSRGPEQLNEPRKTLA